MHPDYWTLLSMGGYYKVLSSFYGGYLSGESWRMSSAVTDIKLKGDTFLITTQSGNVYHCRKDSKGMNSMATGIYEALRKDNRNIKRVDPQKVMWRFK